MDALHWAQSTAAAEQEYQQQQSSDQLLNMMMAYFVTSGEAQNQQPQSSSASTPMGEGNMMAAVVAAATAAAQAAIAQQQQLNQSTKPTVQFSPLQQRPYPTISPAQANKPDLLLHYNHQRQHDAVCHLDAAAAAAASSVAITSSPGGSHQWHLESSNCSPAVGYGLVPVCAYGFAFMWREHFEIHISGVLGSAYDVSSASSSPR